MSGRIAPYAAARDAKAVAMFHGGVYTRDFDGSFAGQEPIGNFIPKLSCPVLGAFGERDPRVPPGKCPSLQERDGATRQGYQIRIFRDTDHAWLNLKSHTYHHESAEAAWAMFITFLLDVFAGKWTRR